MASPMLAGSLHSRLISAFEKELIKATNGINGIYLVAIAWSDNCSLLFLLGCSSPEKAKLACALQHLEMMGAGLSCS